MNIINKTPHPINIVDADGNILRTYVKTDEPIRLAVTVEKDSMLPDGTQITKTNFGEAENLPYFREDTCYIVSQLVKNALPNRGDLFVPAEVVRDKTGNIIGCKSLGK